MPKNKSMAALAFGLSITICLFFYASLNGEQTQKQEKPDAAEEHWHKRYVEDNCKRCPECCIRSVGDEFIDPYGVKRPSSWLPPQCDSQPHCQNCPSDECVCIKDSEGCWMIEPEVGE